METGIEIKTEASWKGQSKLQEPKRRGMILEPQHETEDPSAVSSLTSEVEEEVGAGNTEMEALEMTRKWCEEFILKVNQRRALEN